MSIGPQKQPSSIRQIEAQSRQVTRELAAIHALLTLVEDDCRSLVESNSQLTEVNGRIRPIPNTLDPEAVGIVAKYDRAIALAYEALGVD